ncbi:lipoma-preferred partner homolog isoform X2 [Pungitius pungitius]|uniref:lipoma-preferred partner homolog isoform X2 n=1 Tax=Pungitius pungitius TaxID=134920 RepID=UPI002E131C66
MSGPTWLPPRTLDSPERAAPQMSHSAGSAIYRAPNKKGTPDFRPKYGPYDQNGGGGAGGGGGGGGGMANRYMATGPTGGPIHHSSSDHYYPPPHGPKEDRTWSPHMDSYELMHRGPEKPASYHSKIDADIDSLTSMLADLDSRPQDPSAQLYDNVPYNQYLSGDHYKPAHQGAGPPQGRPSMGYSPHPQGQYHPAPRYPGEHQPPQYSASHQPDYYSSSSSSPSSSSNPKPYPQPVPASYTTASTPTGPRFSVQVKTAQPVTYSQTGRQAEQAYTPPPPRQHVPRPPPQTSPQGWYPPHPGSQAQEMHSEAAYKGGGSGPGGRLVQVPQSKRGVEGHQTGPSPAYQPSKGIASTRPEEELDRLTKKLVYDMNHPPVEDYFGRCSRCGDNVVGDGSGCIAMEQVFHVECFTCITCHARLRGQPFYALDKKSYCESCYISAVQSAPSPSWTVSCGPWGRPTTLAVSPAWFATAAWTACPSPWTPPLRYTASTTSTGSTRLAARCAASPSCRSRARRRRCGSWPWTAAFTSTVTSVRNAASCCPRRARVEAATRWTATSCARTAAPAASRTSRPRSPPTANAPLATRGRDVAPPRLDPPGALLFSFYSFLFNSFAAPMATT